MEGVEDKPADGEKRMDAEQVSRLEEMQTSIFKKLAFAYACKTKRKQLPYLKRNVYQNVVGKVRVINYQLHK